VNTDLVKRDLFDSLKADPKYRHAWNLENVYTGVCFHIRALREQRGWSQAELGKAAKMAQERISILEDPNANTKPTLMTLLRIADACDVGLDVRFVSYRTVIDRSTKTDLKAMGVPSFEDELPELEREFALVADKQAAAKGFLSRNIVKALAGGNSEDLDHSWTSRRKAANSLWYREARPMNMLQQMAAIGNSAAGIPRCHPKVEVTPNPKQLDLWVQNPAATGAAASASGAQVIPINGPTQVNSNLGSPKWRQELA
jgi:transcriptional regulator with XRE-family HTH domain